MVQTGKNAHYKTNKKSLIKLWKMVFGGNGNICISCGNSSSIQRVMSLFLTGWEGLAFHYFIFWPVIILVLCWTMFLDCEFCFSSSSSVDPLTNSPSYHTSQSSFLFVHVSSKMKHTMTWQNFLTTQGRKLVYRLCDLQSFILNMLDLFCFFFYVFFDNNYRSKL